MIDDILPINPPFQNDDEDGLFFRLQKENALLPPQVKKKKKKNIVFFSPLNDIKKAYKIIGFHSIHISANRKTKYIIRKGSQVDLHSIK